MDNRKIKEAIDRKISDRPLYTDSDRKRFYRNKHTPRIPINWLPAFPKVLTFLLAFLLIGGGVYFIGIESPFQSPGVPQKETADKQAPLSEDSTRVDFEKVKNKAQEIKKSFHGELTLQEAENLFGEGITYERMNLSTNSSQLTSEFVYFTNERFNHAQNMAFSEDDFKKGKLGLLFEITWENENQIKSAVLTYLNQNGELITERYNSEGFFEMNNSSIETDDNKLAMQDLVLQSMAYSLNENVEDLTARDLGRLSELTINASDSSGIFDVNGDPDYFAKMENLTELTLNQARIPGDLMKFIPNLERVTFKGPTLNDLSLVEEGLNKIVFLNIKESSFRGNAEDILQLEQLQKVVLDKSVVTDWQQLEENGIQVFEEMPN